MDLRDPSIALRHRWIHWLRIYRSIAQPSIDRAIIDRSRTTALARSMDRICARALVWTSTSFAKEISHFIHYSRIDMDPIFKTRMTAIATSKAASAKSCVLSQEKFDAIVRHLSSPQDKVDPHFKHWVKSRHFQLADLPGLGLFKVLVIPNEGNNKVCTISLGTRISLNLLSL